MSVRAASLYSDHLSEEEKEFIQQIDREADSTPAKDKGLALHVGAILKLRAKGYSYRDIAGWFNERGFKVNHVDAWRAHRSALEIEDCIQSAELDPEWKEFVETKHSDRGTLFTEVDDAVEAKLEAESKVSAPTDSDSKTSQVEQVAQRPKSKRANSPKGPK